MENLSALLLLTIILINVLSSSTNFVILKLIINAPPLLETNKSLDSSFFLSNIAINNPIVVVTIMISATYLLLLI